MRGQVYVAKFDGREVGRVSSAERLAYAVVVRNNAWLARQRAYHGSGIDRRESVEAFLRGGRVFQGVPEVDDGVYLANRVRQFEADVADGRFAPRVSHWCKTLHEAQSRAASLVDPAVQMIGIVPVRSQRLVRGGSPWRWGRR